MIDKGTLRIAPSFIEPLTIKQLSEEQQIKLVSDIRERRLIAVAIHLQLQEEKKKVKDEKLSKQMDTQIKRVASCIEKIDGEMEKLEGYFGKLRALRFEALDLV